MSERSFLSELKRRNVYKVAVAYAVVGWLLVQIATQVFPFLEIPNWAVRLVIALVAIGFPIALVIAWAFETTSQGIVATETADAMPGAVKQKRYAWIYIVAFGAALSIGLFLMGRYTARDTASAAHSELTAKSIAVLPFDNLSEDKGNAFFAEGVQDEILTRLAKVADLKVISRTSTQKYKSAPDNLREIAKQLGVMHVLEGSVQKASDQVRVNVQLINAMTDAHLWAETYDRNLTDIFAVETEIAKTIADMLQAKLSGSEKMMMAKRPTENSEAYDLYLKGRYFWNKRTEADLRKSIDYFNQAIAKDPNFARAYAGIAQSWCVLTPYNGGAPMDTYPQGRIAATKALSIDSTLSEAVAALASCKAMYDFDFPGARQEYERALELDPNDATTHHWFATDVLTNTGQHERELAEMKRAVELDPLSLVLQTNLGNAYVHNGRLDEAVAQFRKTIEMDANFYFAQWSYGLALELQGKIPEAIAQLEKGARMADDPSVLGFLGQAYAIAGRKEEAHQLLEKLLEFRKQRYTPAYALALIYLGLGDRNEALNWLEQSYRDHDGNAIGPIRIDPLLIPLRGDPRFEALAEKIVPAREFRQDVSQK